MQYSYSTPSYDIRKHLYLIHPIYNCDTYFSCVPYTWTSHFNPSLLNTISLILSVVTFRPFLQYTSTKRPTISFRSSFNSPYKTKSSAYKRPGSLHSSLFQKSHSYPPHSDFHLFHHCIHRLKSQVDRIQSCLTAWSILKHSLSSPFTLT